MSCVKAATFLCLRWSNLERYKPSGFHDVGFGIQIVGFGDQKQKGSDDAFSFGMK